MNYFCLNFIFLIHFTVVGTQRVAPARVEGVGVRSGRCTQTSLHCSKIREKYV